jgi:membrane associated rhomboid family serine protease
MLMALLLLLAAAPCADALLAAPSHSPAASVLKFGLPLRVRGGNDSMAFWATLRHLISGSRRAGEEPSVVETVLDTVEALPPTTRSLLIANVCVYIAARLGLLGGNPAERYGFCAIDVLMDPARHWHKLLTGALLHLNHAHIVSNMAVLASVGSKLENRLGTQRMAALVALLVPVIGVTQLTLTVALNAAAAAVGVHDIEGQNTTMRGSRGALHSATQIVRHQVSVNTVSIGFSGVLFALNALAMRILSGTSTMRYAEKSPTQRNLPFFRSN